MGVARMWGLALPNLGFPWGVGVMATALAPELLVAMLGQWPLIIA